MNRSRLTTPSPPQHGRATTLDGRTPFNTILYISTIPERPKDNEYETEA